MNFSILIPTKNRIKNIENVLKTIYETASDKENVEVVFYVDNDDLNSQNFINAQQNKNIKWTTSEQKILFSDMWNYAYKSSVGKYVMLCGDDVEFKTKGWDEKVLAYFNKCEDKIIYAVPVDGTHNGNLGIHGFISRKWAEIVGFFTPPYFSYWYADTWLDDVARKINRFVYMPDVEVLHFHPYSPYKKQMDAVYLSNQSKLNHTLHQLYKDKELERQEQSQKLLEYIKSFNNNYQKKLSILICSIERRRNLLDKLLESLKRQVRENNFQNMVEILLSIDNEQMPTGKKRNMLLEKSVGEYVVFIDDDDEVSDNYIKNILNALDEKPDCVGFRGTIFMYNNKYVFNNSIKYVKQTEHETLNHYDNVSHINPIKANIAKNFKFPDRFWGEDSGWLENLRKTLKKEVFIEDLMYFYTPSNEDILKKNKDKNV